MKTLRQRGLGPSPLIAIGIIVSTLVAKGFAQSSLLVMAGPAVLAATLISASVIALPSARRRATGQTGFLSMVVLLAGAIVAVRDPDRMALFMPVLGAAAGGVFITKCAKGTYCQSGDLKTE